MIVRTINTEQIFKQTITDPTDARLKKLRAALGEIAGKFNGRITSFDLKGTNIRITFGAKDVAEGVTKALKERNIDLEEVNLIDEFFDEVSVQTANLR